MHAYVCLPCCSVTVADSRRMSAALALLVPGAWDGWLCVWAWQPVGVAGCFDASCIAWLFQALASCVP
jgi:hypothetical protein